MPSLHLAGRSLALVAALILCGGHWALMQTVAWTGMLLENSRSETTFAAAVTKTFNGQNPCSLCKKIDLAHAEEEQAPASPHKPVKIEALATFAAATFTAPPPSRHTFAPFHPSGDQRDTPPPGPIPIAA